MQLSHILLVFLVTVYMANGAPTFDVLYKIARDLENELVSETVGHQRPPPPGYGQPYVNGYYPHHSHDRIPPVGVYPERYPPTYPGTYPGTSPGTYPNSAPHYPDAYTSRHPPYPHTNYIQVPVGTYDDSYRPRGNGYGQVKPSYPGYKTNGY